MKNFTHFVYLARREKWEERKGEERKKNNRKSDDLLSCLVGKKVKRKVSRKKKKIYL